MKAAVLVLALVSCSDSLSVPESPTGSLSIGPENGCRGGACADVSIAAQSHLRLLATAPLAKPDLQVASTNESAVVVDRKVTCSSTACDYIVEVDTKAAGVADITFSNPDGTLVDLVRLQIK